MNETKDLELLGTAQAAVLLGVAEATLRWWRFADRGPKSFKVGKLVKYRRADLLAWVNAQYATTAVGGDAA